MEQQPVVTAMTDSMAPSTVEVSTPAVAQQRIEAQPVQREEPKAQAFVAEPPPSVAVAPAPAPTPAPAPIQAEAAPVVHRAPVAITPAAPQQDPKEVLSSSGLVMIETDPSRSKSYQLEEDRVQLGRPRRERPKQGEGESLMQVETKN